MLKVKTGRMNLDCIKHLSENLPPNLEELDLSNNDIQDKGLALMLLYDLPPKLRSLNLSYNRLSSIGITIAIQL